MTGVKINMLRERVGTPQRAVEGGHINAPEVSQVGNALQRLGNEVREFGVMRAQEKAEAEAAATLAQHQLDVDQVIIEERDRATDGAEGLSATVHKRLEQMRTDRLKSARSPLAKKFLSDRMLAVNTDGTRRAMGVEDAEAHRYSMDRFGIAGDAIEQAGAANPDQLPVRLAEYEQLVLNAPRLSADERRTLIHTTREKASGATAEAMVARDPAGTLSYLRRSLGVPDAHDSRSAEIADIMADYETVLADGGTEAQAQALVDERMQAIGGTKGEAFDVTVPGSVPRYIADLPIAKRVQLLARAEDEASYRAGREAATGIWQRSGGSLDRALGMIGELPDAKLADDVERRVRLLDQDAHHAREERDRDVRENLIGQVQLSGLDSLSEPERSAAAVLGIMPNLHEMERDRVQGRGAITDPVVEGQVVTAAADPQKFLALDFTKGELLTKLSAADRLHYVQEQQQLRAKLKDGARPVLSAELAQVHDAIEQHIRVDLGLDPKVRESLKAEDLPARNRALNYTGRMQAAIDLWAKQHGNVRPDVTTIQKISDQLLLRIPVVPGKGGPFDPKGDSVHSFEAEKIRSIEQVPPQFRAEIAKRLQAGGYPVDEAHVLRYYVDAARMGVFK